MESPCREGEAEAGLSQQAGGLTQWCVGALVGKPLITGPKQANPLRPYRLLSGPFSDALTLQTWPIIGNVHF